MAVGVDPNDIYHNGMWYSRTTGANSLSAGQLYIDYTNTSTVGAVTINKAAGRVICPASTPTVTVTNSLVTAASKVFTQIATNDTNGLLKNCIPSNGSFLITFYSSPLADCAVDFFVVNAD